MEHRFQPEIKVTAETDSRCGTCLEICNKDKAWPTHTGNKYDGLTTEVTVVGAIGETPQVTKTTTDTLGRPITMTDANGGLTRHGYGPFSQLRTMTGPDNVTMSFPTVMTATNKEFAKHQR